MSAFDRWAKRTGFGYLNEDEAPLPDFSDDPDMPDLSLCSFKYLATEMRKRGATVTPVQHGGDKRNLTPAENEMIDAAWEKHKAAAPALDWPPQGSAIGLADGTRGHGSTGQLFEVKDSQWKRVADGEVDRSSHSYLLGVAQANNASLRDAMQEACDLLTERKHGNPARSPGHNARLILEVALNR